MRKFTPIPFILLLSCSNHIDQTTSNNEPVEVLKTSYYDGQSDDLLTAGLGLSGLRSVPPTLSEIPTASELRKASYYHQFKALNDVSAAGGFGSLYGFNETQETIAGHEYWSQRSVADGVYHSVVMQLPDQFNAAKPCLVVAPSSGSRNVLGAVGTSGSWALIHGCAVVYSDKGTGTDVALDGDSTYQIDGITSARNHLSEASTLQAVDSNHVVQKHAYSQVNPEQYWGHFVLDAANYGLALLQQEKGLNRNQVKVIAASVSNGGGAVLRATEIDIKGTIDAVVAAEPQINLDHDYSLKTNSELKNISTKTLIELSMNLSLYEPCAALDESLNGAPFKANTALIQGLQATRCEALHQHGYLTASELKGQISESLGKINQLQIEQPALQLSQLNTLANMWGAINHTYSNSYLKKSAKDNLCQSAMSAFTAQGLPRPLTDAEKTGMFALSNGIAPSNGIELAATGNDNKIQSRMILSAGYGFESQSCFYKLLNDTVFQSALDSVKAQPEANQVPTIILHGQADGTIAINHASRAYYHRNQSSESANKNMHYYEIENAQHFDAFLAYPGFDQKFVPMHPYFEQALDMMYQHLFSGDTLPESQLIKTQARGMASGQVPALTADNIPPIKQKPTTTIKVNQQQLEIQ